MQDYSKFVVAGNWQKGDISLSIVNSSFHLDEELRYRIENIWGEELTKAKQAGKLMYNGLHYRLEDIKIGEQTINLRISPLDFKTRMGIGILSETTEMPMLATLNIGGFVETTDGKFVFGKKGNLTLAEEGKIEFIGGGLEGENISDIFNQNEAEIGEELGVSKSHISSQELVSILLTPRGNYIFLTHNRLTVDSNELVEIFNKENDGEFSELVFIEKSDLKEFLHELGNYKILIADNFSKLNLS